MEAHSRQKNGLCQPDRTFIGLKGPASADKGLLGLLRPMDGSLCRKRAFVGQKGPFVGLKGPFSGPYRDISSQHRDLSDRKMALLDQKSTLSNW